MDAAHPPRTLVTGASSGIGAALARALAARGEELVLVARSADRLEGLAGELRRSGRAVDVIAADLAAPAGVPAVLAALDARGIAVGTLVNNAGFGLHGSFASHAPERLAEMIALNCGAVVALTRALLPAMLARRAGTVVTVASVAALQPVPYMAVYGASKAFALSFSEALHEEVRTQGVRVVAVCPGQTSTAFFGVSQGGRIGRARTTEQVVATTLRAIDRNRAVAIDGFANTLLAQSGRFAPRAAVRRLTGGMMRGAAERHAG